MPKHKAKNHNRIKIKGKLIQTYRKNKRIRFMSYYTGSKA